MAPSEQSSTRKRLRSRIEDEVDELSPLPGKAQTSAAKRRKVDAPSSTLGGISKRFKEHLGLGAKKDAEDGVDELGEDIYDFKVTDDEEEKEEKEENAKARGKSTDKPIARDATTASSATKEGVLTPKRGRGRPRKIKDGLEKAKAVSQQALRSGATKNEQNLEHVAGDEDAESADTSTKPCRSRPTRPSDPKSRTSVVRGKNTEVPGSSTPKRGRPRRIIDGLADSVAVVPKGILTPSKSRNPTIRKSVVFDESGKDSFEGFKDIPVRSRTVAPWFLEQA